MPEACDITKYIDRDAALSRIRNEKLYRRLLGLFLEYDEFDKLEDALARRDMPAAAASAHAIKGITGNLSLPLLFELSSHLIEQFKQGVADNGLIAEFGDARVRTFELVRESVAELNGRDQT